MAQWFGSFALGPWVDLRVHGHVMFTFLFPDIVRNTENADGDDDMVRKNDDEEDTKAYFMWFFVV